MPLLPLDLTRLVWPLGLAALLGAVGVRQVSRYWRMPPGTVRQQVRWATFGFVCGILFFIVSMLSGLFADALGSDLLFPLMVASAIASLLAVLAIVAGLLLSLLRYRLYDADAVIGRSAAYGVLTLGFVAVFAAGEKAIEALAEAYLGGSLGATAGGIAAALAAVVVVPLHERVGAWAERRFQKHLLALRHDLPHLVGDLRETVGAGRIADAAVTAAMAGVQASRAAILAGDTVLAAHGALPDAVASWAHGREIAAEPVANAQRDPLFPMRVPLASEAIGQIGWLLLGPRPDGSLYGRDEREAPVEIAAPVARAIEIARVREARDRALNDRIAALEALVMPAPRRDRAASG
ncbi:hypothetical protein [Sphingomonas baiyangensis]|uniref:Uncharacterized protein n=1 Tax=Sphingomonas baiyangensis TaxID=2572576 RepID=A0A4U1L7G0_9SPHN|nr:hypothetical protein [Sphingomonas baiyangensis]TKD52887.1 hypothetical protein FBR43_00595 [Sphingomonas baiyangensis]